MTVLVSFTPKLSTLTANLASGSRRLIEDGREKLVVPVTMIVPGVLDGSRGPLLYERSDVASSAKSWNGRPLLMYHPVRNGRPVWSTYPGVVAEDGLGEVRNARVRETDGALIGDAWFDLDRLRTRDAKLPVGVPKVLPRLLQNQRVEVSTGLGTINVPVRNGLSFNGKGYVAVARHYKPDHLAVLPDQVGACSLRDGCGLLVNDRRTRRDVVHTFAF